METENTQSTNTEATERSGSAPVSREHAWPARTKRIRILTLVIGGVAVLALGMLLGIGATKHLAGIPAAAAATKAMHSAAPHPAQAAATPDDSAAWNPFQEMRDMQLRMDRMFDQMSSQFRMEPRLSLFADNPGYSLSLRVQDLKDHFEVHAYLPNAKASDIKVSLLDKQTLKVEVTNKTTVAANQKSANQQSIEWGQYAQIIRLPAPVKSEQMKLDQPTHELIVTLPKA